MDYDLLEMFACYFATTSTHPMTRMKSIVREIKRDNSEKPLAVVGSSTTASNYATVLALGEKLAHFTVRENPADLSGQDPFRNHRFIVIEHVMTDGQSIIDTIHKLPSEDVSDIIITYYSEMFHHLNSDELLQRQFPDARLHIIRNNFD